MIDTLDDLLAFCLTKRADGAIFGNAVDGSLALGLCCARLEWNGNGNIRNSLVCVLLVVY